MMAIEADSKGVAAQCRPRRMLVLVDGSERSHWALAYATAQGLASPRPGVVLLYVADPVSDWETFRFRAQKELAGAQQAHGKALLDDAARHLRATGTRCETHFRVGLLPHEIVDAADVLNCDAIVLPTERPLLMRLFERDITHEVLQLDCGISIITVDAVGKPVRGG